MNFLWIRFIFTLIIGLLVEKSIAETIKCETLQALPTLEEMEQKLEKQSKLTPLKNYGVGGLFLVDENIELIDSYRLLVTYKDYKARPLIDIDYWAQFKDSHCNKALSQPSLLLVKS